MPSTLAIRISLCFASALLVLLADAIIKSVAAKGSWTSILFHPKMLVCYILYAIQIVATIHIFRKHGELAIYTNLFVIFYGVLGILAGRLLFGEAINWVQYVGIVLGLLGAVLMNHQV